MLLAANPHLASRLAVLGASDAYEMYRGEKERSAHLSQKISDMRERNHSVDTEIMSATHGDGLGGGTGRSRAAISRSSTPATVFTSEGADGVTMMDVAVAGGECLSRATDLRPLVLARPLRGETSVELANTHAGASLASRRLNDEQCEGGENVDEDEDEEGDGEGDGDGDGDVDEDEDEEGDGDGDACFAVRREPYSCPLSIAIAMLDILLRKSPRSLAVTQGIAEVVGLVRVLAHSSQQA